MEELWERIGRAVKMVHECGFNAWPLEREAVDRDARALVQAVARNFVHEDPAIRGYLEEIRRCGWKIIRETEKDEEDMED